MPAVSLRTKPDRAQSRDQANGLSQLAYGSFRVLGEWSAIRPQPPKSGWRRFAGNPGATPRSPIRLELKPADDYRSNSSTNTSTDHISMRQRVERHSSIGVAREH